MTIRITTRKCTVNKTKKKKMQKNVLPYAKQVNKKNITLVAILENECLENENQAN